VAAEARGADRQELRDADPPPLAADRRRRRARGLGAPLQAARRPGDARPREARGTVAPLRRTLGLATAGLAAGAAAWGLHEAQWLERRRLDLPVAGLHPDLDGLTILHLSDLHLGTVSLNARALGRALDWAAEEEPDLVAVTGDLVTRAGGRGALERALGRLSPPLGTYVVLGNHDVDESRDPFRKPIDLSDLRVPGTALLRDEQLTVRKGDAAIQVVGVDPVTYRHGASGPAGRADEGADLRILLCHYPDVVRWLPPGLFQVVLAGHFHGGQICVPSPWGRLRLKDFRASYWEGLFETPAGPLHVSRGLGTSFVPFRFFARPEATLLTLRAAS
jgi:predicted MPP superfamily phosphohydrolase